MLFFLLLVAGTLVATGLHFAGVGRLADWPARMRIAMALALSLVGTDHS